MGLTHSFFLIPVPVTGIQQRRVGGAGESFRPKDLGWLDSCDEHRNEEREEASPNRSERTSFHVEVETERREQGLRRDPGAPPRRP
ncbi:hypothetical protein CN161_02600 [Sinorhizobium meliloti]|nr:hypothetical protein CN161_02600 [Sinorhizobium meliloti]